MKKIFMIVIALGVSFLCCRQKTDFRSGNVVPILPSPPNIAVNKRAVETGAKAGEPVLPPSRPEVDGSGKTGVAESEQQQKAYNDLKKKVEQIKRLYDHRDPDVLYFNDAFKSKFGRDLSHQNKYVYAALGGDKGSMTNLEKVLIHVHRTVSDYNGSPYGGIFYSTLQNIGDNYFDSVIHFYYGPNGFLEKLKDVEDVQGLRSLVDDLETLRFKWKGLVAKLQDGVKGIAEYCDEYLKVKDQASKSVERVHYIGKILTKSNIIISAVQSRGMCKGAFCDAIKDFLSAKSDVELKSNALVR
ncbi:hypothetical protein [Borrelia persica]|uniref:hypothetical protein n=1 Tax=Borrelia persica TaxID=44448 RepID=UPI000464BBAD|nr:hypothetical protein [Borrelia persica]